MLRLFIMVGGTPTIGKTATQHYPGRWHTDQFQGINLTNNNKIKSKPL